MTGGPSHTSESSTFDIGTLLRELDAIFEAQQGPTHAEPHLVAGLETAQSLGDSGAVLTILNELTGFYRVTSAHPAAVATARRAMALAQELGLEGSDAYATTLINVATALRSAGEYEEALALYRQALATAQATMSPRDRRIAALHNTLSMLFSDQGQPALARTELEAALAAVVEGHRLLATPAQLEEGPALVLVRARDRARPEEVARADRRAVDGHVGEHLGG